VPWFDHQCYESSGALTAANEALPVNKGLGRVQHIEKIVPGAILVTHPASFEKNIGVCVVLVVVSLLSCFVLDLWIAFCLFVFLCFACVDILGLLIHLTRIERSDSRPPSHRRADYRLGAAGCAHRRPPQAEEAETRDSLGDPYVIVCLRILGLWVNCCSCVLINIY
jgi:hypothetical protein